MDSRGRARVERSGGETQLVAKVQVSRVDVIGKAWAQVGRQILVLLHGDIGRLDGGTLDRNVKAFARERGVEL